jgi:hypothetical protein
MLTRLIPVVALALLPHVAPAWAQTPAGPDLQGVIEEIRDSELLVRGTDGRLHHVDTAAIPSTELGTLNPGDTVVLATKAVTAPRAIGHHVKHRTPAPKR